MLYLLTVINQAAFSCAGGVGCCDCKDGTKIKKLWRFVTYSEPGLLSLFNETFLIDKHFWSTNIFGRQITDVIKRSRLKFQLGFYDHYTNKQTNIFVCQEFVLLLQWKTILLIVFYLSSGIPKFAPNFFQWTIGFLSALIQFALKI